jgi:hypothetical protein
MWRCIEVFGRRAFKQTDPTAEARGLAKREPTAMQLTGAAPPYKSYSLALKP